MGLKDILDSGYQPKENQEFGNKKKLIGDAVCQVTLEKRAAKATGKEWIILKAEAIHTIPDSKGRETTLEPGDSIDKVYDPQDEDSMKELVDDLFTAGIDYAASTDEEATFANAKSATDGKLVYYRTWANSKKKEQMKEGKPDYWQNIKILSQSKVTEENSVPQVQF